MRRISLAVFATILVCGCTALAQQSDNSSQAANSTRTIPPPGTVTGSGTTNYIPLWTGSTTLANSAMYQTSGRIGIGTTSPEATLDVNGAANAASYNIGNMTMLSAGTNTSAGNTFVGNVAGLDTTTGSEDTFVGNNAGAGNTSGYGNTLMGGEAGMSNASASWNTILGAFAGRTNTGNWNTFVGAEAGDNNTTGFFNTYVGNGAGADNATGSYNLNVGYYAGLNNTSGTDNIYIGNQGCASPCTESYTIRIGADANGGDYPQTAAFISGIYGATASSGLPVYINSYGQLGTSSSSARFKENVRDMGGSTDALMKLRPVTFVYKPEYANGERTLQYGLIAEEVAKVYPELVAYDKDGQPYSVRYQYLSTMLLNEVQKQYRRAEAEAEVITKQEQKIDSQQREMEQMQERLSRLEKLIGARVSTAFVDQDTTRGAQ